MSEPKADPMAFVKDLVWLADERNKDPQRRGVLAGLRRGLGRPPGQVMDVERYVAHYLPSQPSDAHDRPFYLVASLFAWHPRNDPRPRNLGASFARMEPGDLNASVERRFMALLSCDAERLPYHLRQAIGLLRAKNIPVDWYRLLRDLQSWENPKRTVQRGWARAFWGHRRGAADPATASPQASPGDIV